MLELYACHLGGGKYSPLKAVPLSLKIIWTRGCVGVVLKQATRNDADLCKSYVKMLKLRPYPKFGKPFFRKNNYVDLSSTLKL